MKNNKMSTTLKRQTETDPFVSTQSCQSTKAERSIGSIDIFGSICPLLMFICLYNTSVQEALSGVFVESPNSNQYILTIQYLWQLQAYDNPNQSSHSGLKLLDIVKAISKLITSNCRASVVKMFAMFLSMVIVKRVGFLTCE